MLNLRSKTLRYKLEIESSCFTGFKNSDICSTSIVCNIYKSNSFFKFRFWPLQLADIILPVVHQMVHGVPNNIQNTL